MAEGNGDIRALQTSITEWANSIYPNRTVLAATSKLLEEIGEFLKKPDADEFADLCIIIWDLASLRGIDIKEAVLHKMAINRARRWRIDEKTGIMSHIPNEQS